MSEFIIKSKITGQQVDWDLVEKDARTFWQSTNPTNEWAKPQGFEKNAGMDWRNFIGEIASRQSNQSCAWSDWEPVVQEIVMSAVPYTKWNERYLPENIVRSIEYVKPYLELIAHWSEIGWLPAPFQYYVALFYDCAAEDYNTACHYIIRSSFGQSRKKFDEEMHELCKNEPYKSWSFQGTREWE